MPIDTYGGVRGAVTLPYSIDGAIRLGEADRGDAAGTGTTLDDQSEGMAISETGSRAKTTTWASPTARATRSA